MLSLCLFSLIWISSLKGHFSHFPYNSHFVFSHAKEKKRRKDLYSICLSQSCLTYSLPSVCSLCLGQMAVSHTTACGLWQGGVPVLRGSGVFLQLGNIGILSCLHKLLSGRRWALISLHRQRFLSITSRSLPSRLAGAVEVPDVPVLRGAWACAASWASCWNWSWTCCWYCCCRLRDGLQGAWACAWICARACNYTQRQREKLQKLVCIFESRWNT